MGHSLGVIQGRVICSISVWVLGVGVIQGRIICIFSVWVLGVGVTQGRVICSISAGVLGVGVIDWTLNFIAIFLPSFDAGKGH